jgi:hypothetical protein
MVIVVGVIYVFFGIEILVSIFFKVGVHHPSGRHLVLGFN